VFVKAGRKLTACSSQIVSWFESLLHTMKIYAGHSHAVDDYTEALFSAIEHKHRMKTHAALAEVSWFAKRNE
jgi:hypothetical protein